MTQLKADLICEIIRKSQTNLLEKMGRSNMGDAEAHEIDVMDWIRNNAKEYRDYFYNLLNEFSTTELGEILKVLNETGKDLNEILNKTQGFVAKTKS